MIRPIAGTQVLAASWAVACGAATRIRVRNASATSSAQRLPSNPTVGRSPIFPLPVQLPGGSDVFVLIECGCTVVLWGGLRNAPGQYHLSANSQTTAQALARMSSTRHDKPQKPFAINQLMTQAPFSRGSSVSRHPSRNAAGLSSG